jgi:hypothetical protein
VEDLESHSGAETIPIASRQLLLCTHKIPSSPFWFNIFRLFFTSSAVSNTMRR